MLGKQLKKRTNNMKINKDYILGKIVDSLIIGIAFIGMVIAVLELS